MHKVLLALHEQVLPNISQTREDISSKEKSKYRFIYLALLMTCACLKVRESVFLFSSMYHLGLSTV